MQWYCFVFCQHKLLYMPRAWLDESWSDNIKLRETRMWNPHCGYAFFVAVFVYWWRMVKCEELLTKPIGESLWSIDDEHSVCCCHISCWCYFVKWMWRVLRANLVGEPRSRTSKFIQLMSSLTKLCCQMFRRLVHHKHHLRYYYAAAACTLYSGTLLHVACKVA